MKKLLMILALIVMGCGEPNSTAIEHNPNITNTPDGMIVNTPSGVINTPAPVDRVPWIINNTSLPETEPEPVEPIVINGPISYIGDSITRICSNRYPIFFSGDTVFAISGWTTHDVEANLDLYPVMEVGNTNHVYVLIGVNNIIQGESPEEFRANMESLLARISQYPTAIVTGILPTTDAEFNVLAQEMNVIIQEMVAGHSNMRYYDAWPSLTIDGVLPQSLTIDWVHLNEEGCQIYFDGLVQ